MKRFSIALAAAALLASAACARTDSPTEPSGPQPTAGTVLVIPAGESRSVSGTGLTLTFTAVASDSRCPEGVQCFWQGDAVVRVSVATPSSPARTVELSLNRPNPVLVGGVALRLVAADPYPVEGQATPFSAYVITVSVL